jgi:hypothetical protein
MEEEIVNFDLSFANARHIERGPTCRLEDITLLPQAAPPALA